MRGSLVIGCFMVVLVLVLAVPGLFTHHGAERRAGLESATDAPHVIILNENIPVVRMPGLGGDR